MKLLRAYDIGEYDGEFESGFVLGKHEVSFSNDLEVRSERDSWKKLRNWDELFGYIRAVNEEMQQPFEDYIQTAYRQWGPESDKQYSNISGTVNEILSAEEIRPLNDRATEYFYDYFGFYPRQSNTPLYYIIEDAKALFMPKREVVQVQGATLR